MSDEVRLSFKQSVWSNSGNEYQVLQQVGEGRNADAYLVLGTSGDLAGVPLVLKLFRRIASVRSAQRFLEETQFLKSCVHPSIMRVFDDGVYRTMYPFVIIEYLPMTLRQAMSRSISTVEKLAYVLQLLSGLRYLQMRQPPVIHCDLKPENVFIKGTSCVIGDFGLVRSDDGKLLTVDEEIPPIPRRYRTPDYVNFAKRIGKLTFKSDVFQLGLVAAELFSGENPEKDADDKSSPVELKSIARIAGQHGPLIATLIKLMLEMEAEKRLSAVELLDRWRTPFIKVAELSHAVDERVFYS